MLHWREYSDSVAQLQLCRLGWTHAAMSAWQLCRKGSRGTVHSGATRVSSCRQAWAWAQGHAGSRGPRHAPPTHVPARLGCRWPGSPPNPMRWPHPDGMPPTSDPRSPPSCLTHVLCLQEPGAGDGLVGADLVGVVQLLDGGVLVGLQQLAWWGQGRVSATLAGPQRGCQPSPTVLAQKLVGLLAIKVPAQPAHLAHVLPLHQDLWGRALTLGGWGGAQGPGHSRPLQGRRAHSQGRAW